MSFLTRLMGADGATPRQRDPSDEFWWSTVGGASIAGERVTLDSALQVPTVYACLTVLSETIGSLPYAIFERDGDARRKTANHPLAAVFSAPNADMTDFEFFAQLVWDVAGAGNSFWEVTSGPRGPIDQFHWLDPRCVTVERLTDGSRRYRIRETGKAERLLLDDRVWHIRDLPLVENLVGKSRIEVGREAIGGALAAQRFASQFFANDLTPPYAIIMPAPFSDTASKKNYMGAITRWMGGANRGKPGLFDRGEKIEKLGHTNEEAQFLETRKEQAYDIARIWRMQPHKVGLLERSTNNNIEQQSLEFVMDTLRPWLELIERSIDRFLILNSERFFFEFNVAGLLRGDIKTRFEAYATARQWGWMSVNEIRALENMNPTPAGDIYITPMNMAPAGANPEARLLGAAGETVSAMKGGVWTRATPGQDAVSAVKLAA